MLFCVLLRVCMALYHGMVELQRSLLHLQHSVEHPVGLHTLISSNAVPGSTYASCCAESRIVLVLEYSRQLACDDE